MQRTIALITQQLSIVLSQYMIRLPDESSRMAKRNMNRHECVLLRHGVLLVFGAPCQLQSLAGQEHGRTIPLADIGQHFRSVNLAGTMPHPDLGGRHEAAAISGACQYGGPCGRE